MAEANLTVGVEVSLSVDENTAVWLESMGWIRPGAPSSEEVQTEPDTEDTEDTEDWDPAEMMAVDVESLVSEARPLATGGVYRGKAMTGDEARWCQARKARAKIVAEMHDSEVVDHLLQLCDVNMKRLFAEDCGC